MTTNSIAASSLDAPDVSIEEWADQLGLGSTAVLTTLETAKLLRLSERKVRDLIKDGTVPSVRFGRRVLIPVPPLLRGLMTDTSQHA